MSDTTTDKQCELDSLLFSYCSTIFLFLKQLFVFYGRCRDTTFKLTARSFYAQFSLLRLNCVSVVETVVLYSLESAGHTNDKARFVIL